MEHLPKKIHQNGISYTLVTGFQFLGDTLRLLHLRDDTRQPVSGLFVQVLSLIHISCKSYFINFLEKSRCFRCRR